MDKDADAFRTISEAAVELDVPQHVLRFWETRFTQIKPLKRGGGRRYYRPDDIELLKAIRSLLYGEGYTIKGVQRLLKEQGVKPVIALSRGEGPKHAERPSSPPSVAMEPDEDDAVVAAGPDEETLRRLRWALTQISECSRILVAANSVT